MTEHNPKEPNDLTHINSHGNAEMVNVADRQITVRTAITKGRVLLSPQVITALLDQQIPKGDVIAAARIAGIMGAKRTSELIPLCHPIAIHKVSLDFEMTSSSVDIECVVITADRTGVEMEALTAVTIAALTIIDMVKSLDPSASITDIRLIEKDGGRNGYWSRSD